MNQILGRQEITTERLLLKPLEVSDAPGMYEIAHRKADDLVAK